MVSPYRSGYRHSRAVLALPLLLMSGFMGWLGLSAAESSRLQNAVPAKTTRPQWTTSRVTGTPDAPPPFKIVRAFPNLKFNHPLLLARCPGSDRLFIGEQAGVLYSFTNLPDARAELFCDLRKEIKTIHLLADAKEIEAVYGLAFHPKFASNRQCFVCYTLQGKKRNQTNLPDGTRVSRFTVTNTEPPRIDPANEEILLSFLQGGHNGGDIHFGPDGMLYVSTGDAGNPNPPDPFSTGQDISDLLSSILRIDVDHKDAGKNYAVPRDNPFIAMKGARPEVWAYGFRNPWRMSFDQQSGSLLVGDVGWELWEMVHRVEKGGNYGWSAMEGPQPIKPERAGPTPIQPPLIELPHTLACSITGGLVYHGHKFPELRGAYIFGDWETRRLWAARFEGDRVREMPEITRPSVRIVAFGADQSGEIYFLDYDQGTVHTIERNDRGGQNNDFPRLLSQTGLFDSVSKHTPAAGVVPFVINSPQWQDGAKTEHWIGLPGDSAMTLYTEGKPVPGLVYWHSFRMHFPQNAVLMRTMSLGGRRVETQLLHFETGDWRGYTYAWRDDQSDADLVPADGGEREISVGGEKRVWQFNNRNQCMSCHSNQSEYALACVPEQLNRVGSDGRNQLIALSEAGYLRRADDNDHSLPPFDSITAGREEKLADPGDASQPLEARARAYLHANCGHCHSDHGGGAVPLRLKYPVKVGKMNAVDARPTRGDFGLPDARIIKPGDPCASTLFFRMAKFGRDRMPHLGAERPDQAALDLMEAWIKGMKATPNNQQIANGEPPIDTALADLATALGASRKLQQMQPTDRSRLLTAAAKLEPGLVRDLFEGYFPAGSNESRKLGSSPRPRTILALSGDVGRGEKLFWSQAANCGSCHKVGDRGTQLGPDLSTIGKLRSREDLLESILEPSRRIEPKFAAYIAHCSDGRAISGLVTHRDEKSVVLRDAQNKEVKLVLTNVETLQPSRTSLMPQGQLAGMTAQEAADLLEYLVSRK